MKQGEGSGMYVLTDRECQRIPVGHLLKHYDGKPC